MNETKYNLEEIITEWKDFERDNNPIKFLNKVQNLKSVVPELGDYIKKYNIEVYQPILKMYFEKAAEVFKMYRKENGLE